MITQLAYWDERRDGICVPVVVDADQYAFACVITRSAAQTLASKPRLTALECFGATYQHMREIASIARDKVAAHRIKPRAAVLIERADVFAARARAQ